MECADKYGLVVLRAYRKLVKDFAGVGSVSRVEGQIGNGRGVRAPLDKVRYAGHECAGFAGAGATDDENWSLRGS